MKFIYTLLFLGLSGIASVSIAQSISNVVVGDELKIKKVLGLEFLGKDSDGNKCFYVLTKKNCELIRVNESLEVISNEMITLNAEGSDIRFDPEIVVDEESSHYGLQFGEINKVRHILKVSFDNEFRNFGVNVVDEMEFRLKKSKVSISNEADEAYDLAFSLDSAYIAIAYIPKDASAEAPVKIQVYDKEFNQQWTRMVSFGKDAEDDKVVIEDLLVDNSGKVFFTMKQYKDLEDIEKKTPRFDYVFVAFSENGSGDGRVVLDLGDGASPVSASFVKSMNDRIVIVGQFSDKENKLLDINGMYTSSFDPVGLSFEDTKIIEFEAEFFEEYYLGFMKREKKAEKKAEKMDENDKGLINFNLYESLELDGNRTLFLFTNKEIRTNRYTTMSATGGYSTREYSYWNSKGAYLALVDNNSGEAVWVHAIGRLMTAPLAKHPFSFRIDPAKDLNFSLVEQAGNLYVFFNDNKIAGTDQAEYLKIDISSGEMGEQTVLFKELKFYDPSLIKSDSEDMGFVALLKDRYGFRLGVFQIE